MLQSGNCTINSFGGNSEIKNVFEMYNTTNVQTNVLNSNNNLEII